MKFIIFFIDSIFSLKISLQQSHSSRKFEEIKHNFAYSSFMNQYIITKRERDFRMPANWYLEINI